MKLEGLTKAGYRVVIYELFEGRYYGRVWSTVDSNWMPARWNTDGTTDVKEYNSFHLTIDTLMEAIGVVVSVERPVHGGK